MVPWPIAGLSLWYGVLATTAASMVWRALIGGMPRPPWWPLAWLALSGGLTVGLPLLRPWARRTAVAASALGMGMTLTVAARCIAGREPLWALLATGGAGGQALLVRYLTRPHVKKWFLKNSD